MDKEKVFFRGNEYTLLDLYSIFENNSKSLNWQIFAAINACDLHLWEIIVLKSNFTLDKIVPFLKHHNLVLFWQVVEKKRKDLLLNLRSLPSADLLVLASIDSRFIASENLVKSKNDLRSDLMKRRKTDEIIENNISNN